MKIEVSKNMLAGALVALGKLVSRMSPVEEYKSVLIVLENGTLRFHTCGPEETMEFTLNCEAEGAFRQIVHFDALQKAIRSGKGKEISLEVESGILLVNGVPLSPVQIEWPEVKVPSPLTPMDLPDGFVEMLSKAAPIVNRNEVRRTLQGIHLSQDGITVTNGKELLNIPCELKIEGLNLPFPLALLSAKPSGEGKLSIWKDRDLTMFRIAYPKWTWTARALPGLYPNWKQVLPPKEHIQHTVEFLPERGQQLEIFLKNVPENPPHNQVELSMSDSETMYIQAGEMRTWITASFSGSWEDFTLPMNKHLLLRLLSLEHTKIEACDGYYPVLATGGTGQYVAMPLYRKTQPQKENPIQPNHKEEPGMVEMNENKVVSAPMPTAAQNNNLESETIQPMDDLTATVESFRLKLKAALDESSNLSRKVKEVQLAQKQKERDFVLAKRAIERIRMVSGF